MYKYKSAKFFEPKIFSSDFLLTFVRLSFDVRLFFFLGVFKMKIKSDDDIQVFGEQIDVCFFVWLTKMSFNFS